MSMKTPREWGYRMPAEWEPHAATWLAWPHNRDTWPGKFEPIPAVWSRLVSTLCRFEPVHILAGGVEEEVRAMTSGLPNIYVEMIPTNDCWARDHGPTFLVGPNSLPNTLLHWGYNAWGGKYPPFHLDVEVPKRIAERLGYERIVPGIILEGGAIDPNGRDAALTTEQCLLNPNRNPGLSRTDIEKYLLDYLGFTHVIWLGEGIVGDDTDGHIDELARFVNERTVVAAWEANKQDPNHAPLEDNLRRLAHAKDEQGRPLEVVKIPMPAPKYFGENRLPASYLNFYIANGVVIAPQYDDPADAEAIATLASLFPDRQVIGLPALDLAWGLGAYHCITQQQPVVNIRKRD